MFFARVVELQGPSVTTTSSCEDPSREPMAARSVYAFIFALPILYICLLTWVICPRQVYNHRTSSQHDWYATPSKCLHFHPNPAGAPLEAVGSRHFNAKDHRDPLDASRLVRLSSCGPCRPQQRKPYGDNNSVIGTPTVTSGPRGLRRDSVVPVGIPWYLWGFRGHRGDY